MQLAELQTLYRKTASQKMQASEQVEELERQVAALNEDVDTLSELAAKRLKMIGQQRDQMKEMIAYIVTTQAFYAHIISKTWKQGATDRDMVLDFLAALPAMR